MAYARAQLPAERPERLRGLGLCVTFARIQLPVLALRASTHSPGINDLFLIVLGTTTITLPNPDGLNTNRALDPCLGIPFAGPSRWALFKFGLNPTEYCCSGISPTLSNLSKSLN